MFCADRQPDGAGRNPLICQFLFGQLGMRCGCRMNDQTLDIGNIGQQGEDLQRIDELPGFLLSSLDLKCEDRSAAVREILLIQRMVG